MLEDETLTEDFKLKLDELDDILQQVDYDSITIDGTKKELGDGYYLSEVETAELTTSKSGNVVVKMSWRVVEDGFTIDLSSEFGELIPLKGTKGQKIFKYYPLKDENSITRFISDMIKFEDRDNKTLVPAKNWTTTEKIQIALRIIIGKRLYMQISDTIVAEDGSVSNWKNPLSWKRAEEIGLPTKD